MAARPDVTPNRRGARSREAVLDAAERLMAAHGYEAATVSRLVEESGIPPSSVYHYFGSKDGVLLAVMERGAERFFASLPLVDERVGRPVEHLDLLVRTVTAALAEHPDFLRLLVVMAAQPPKGDDREIHAVINRIRQVALDGLATQIALAFGADPTDDVVVRLARFTLAAVDGAFVASQAEPSVRLDALLQHLPAALVAMRRAQLPRSR
ncbi:MAG TPA: TetR/AcrR family transcriptional regulator [Solirubrobacteraceae bacterium]|jgi:AcrR family transcriptional regulator|nr:TetR/AcrR family transcriptional regulator [Solirubrobacteraceae bacterium]